MKYVFITLLASLLLKDIAPVGDKYVLRGTSEALALGVGLGWILTHTLPRFAKQYALVFLYLIILSLTALFSQRPLFVVLQVISLFSVIVFFIAYIECAKSNENLLRWNLLIVATSFIAVCAASLGLLLVRPQLAFEITTDGNRFRGLFNEPAMMGAFSGLLLGLATFGRLGWTIRIGSIVTAVPCLYLTGSRTSWGAAISGLLITAIIYLKYRKAWTIAAFIVGITATLGAIAGDLHISGKTASRVMRSDSLETMSGRTSLWTLALEKYQDSPILGYGFTTGSDALISDMDSTLSSAFGVAGSSGQLFSLHSGYIQALLDSGIIGVSLYLAILCVSIWKLFRYDVDRRYGAEMYCLVFFGISNVTDTIIFGAAVFYEVFYWYVAILALSVVRPLRRSVPATSVSLRDELSSMIPSEVAIRSS